MLYGVLSEHVGNHSVCIAVLAMKKTENSSSESKFAVIAEGVALSGNQSERGNSQYNQWWVMGEGIIAPLHWPNGANLEALGDDSISNGELGTVVVGVSFDLNHCCYQY